MTNFNGLELAGKISIKIVQLLTQCMPSLLYWDVFFFLSLSGSSTETPLRLELGSGMGSGLGSGLGLGLGSVTLSNLETGSENGNGLVNVRSMSAAIDIGNIEKWEGFLGLKSDASRCSKEHSLHPTDVLLTATSLGLISTESMIFIITTAARPTSLNYFSSCKYLPYLIENGPIIIFRFIGRYVLSRIVTEYRKLRDKEPACSHGIITLVGISVFNGVHGNSSDRSWVKDPPVQNWMNQNLDAEIVKLLFKLSTKLKLHI